jgi:hypothetical protein
VQLQYLKETLEKTEWGNQEWTTQRYRQHLVHKAQDGDKKEKKETQKRKLNL